MAVTGLRCGTHHDLRMEHLLREFWDRQCAAVLGTTGMREAQSDHGVVVVTSNTLPNSKVADDMIKTLGVAQDTNS